MRKEKYYLLLFLIAWLTLIPMAAVAQTTGKISGNITGADTGEPLAGVNVIIKGTQLGAATDLNGDYYILNVPPGVYTLEIRMIGYATVNINDVRVSVNRTATVDFKLQPTVIMGEEITVQADRISVKKDQTNSIRNISSDEIKMLPAEDVFAVVQMQPGVVENHFRGGRDNEVVYLIDGMKVTESFQHRSNAVEVNAEAVQDIEVITGTFNAEYGDAMSGVVNIVTKEGGKKLEGSISSQFGNYLTDHTDKFIGLSNSEVDRIQDFKLNLSGPLFLNNLTFLFNGRYLEDLGYLDGIHYFNVDDFSDYTSADSTEWHTENTGDGSYVSLNWHNDLLLFGKLTYKPFKSFKVSLSATKNNKERQYYSHSYKYNPYGVPKDYDESEMLTLHVNQMLATSAFYDLKLAYSDYYTGYYLYENPTDSRYVHDEYNKNNGFNTGGQNKGHTRRTEKNLNLKFDLSWQINKRHFLKTGIDVHQITLDQKYSSIQNGYNGSGLEHVFYFDSFANERVYPFYTPVIYPDSSIHSDIYSHKPFKFSSYVQDKMEFESMVVNLGVRFDYFSPDAVYPTNYRNPANQLHQLEESRYSTYPTANHQYQISPRLGLSYQLGESALLRFSYGHFLQLPPLDYYYQNHAFLIRAPDFQSRMGNANLKAQKTIQYEVGLWQQLTSTMNLEVAVYYRDIYDLVTATIYTTYDQIRYGVYNNLEYGNARGLEVKYDFRLNNLSAGINYTLGYTRGIANDPEMSFNRAGQSMDPVNKMIPMAWDQRHVFNTYLGYERQNLTIAAMLYYYSGETYTWSPIAQSPLARINLFPNNQHKPPRYNVDLNASYRFLSFGRFKLTLNLLVYNLLDRLNEVNVNSNTGRADQVIIQESNLIAHRSVYHEYIDQVLDPGRFATPRVVKLGLGITF